jgi:hypothetical protein
MAIPERVPEADATGGAVPDGAELDMEQYHSPSDGEAGEAGIWSCSTTCTVERRRSSCVGVCEGKAPSGAGAACAIEPCYGYLFGRRWSRACIQA